MGPARTAVTLLVDREAGETIAELSGMLRTRPWAGPWGVGRRKEGGNRWWGGGGGSGSETVGPAGLSPLPSHPAPASPSVPKQGGSSAVHD